MPAIEQALLDGADSSQLISWVVETLGIDYKKACDLIKQRVRAIIDNNANIDLIGREADVERLRNLHNKRANRRAELKVVNDNIDKMLLDGEDMEDIVKYVKSTGLINGKTGRADNCRMQVTKRKHYLKRSGLLSK
jgi:hypothetical protein